MKNSIVFFILIFCSIAVLGQGEIDTQEKILYQNERSFSLSLNSNGFGGGFRFGKRKTYLNKTIFDIDLAYIKHPKEEKVATNPYYYTSSRKYTNGKTNAFLSLRPSMGIQHEVYSKEDRGSIAIKYYLSGGPSLGITKPLYYSFNIVDSVVPVDIVYYHVEDQKYDYFYDQPASILSIAGRASFFKGFDEIKLYPGLHAKFGISFEYSRYNQLINAIDVGMVAEVFYKPIPIIYGDNNDQFFFTLFACYRFGRVIDKKYKTPKITKEGQVLSD